MISALGVALALAITRALDEGFLYWLALVVLGAYLALTVVLVRRGDRD